MKPIVVHNTVESIVLLFSLAMHIAVGFSGLAWSFLIVNAIFVLSFIAYINYKTKHAKTRIISLS